MEDELVNQQIGHQTHIRKALLEHRGRRRRTTQHVRLFAFDHRAAVFENDLRPGPLRQAIGHFLADHFIRVGGEIFELRIGEENFLDRDRVVKS